MEKFKRFEGLSTEEIENMEVKEFEEYESNRMEKNAWAVAEEIRQRIDDAPTLGEYIKAFLTEKKRTVFSLIAIIYHHIWRLLRKNVKTYLEIYFKKIWDFYNAHYNTGELFIEYLKNDCLNKEGN